MEINIVERSTTLGPVETTVITVETGMVGPQGPPNTDASLLSTGTVDNARLDAFLQALVAIGATGGTGALARLISPTLTTPDIGTAIGTQLTLSSNFYVGSTGAMFWTNRGGLLAPANGVVRHTNALQTTGVCLDANTADTLTVKNSANSALGSVYGASFRMSSTGAGINTLANGSRLSLYSNNQESVYLDGADVSLGVSASIRIGASGATSGTYDSSISRQSAGVWQFGTTAANALGSTLASSYSLYNAAGNPRIESYSNAGITVYGAFGIGSVRSSSNVIESAGYVYWISRGLLSSSANGVIHVQNFDQNESVNQTLAFGPATTTTNGVRLKRTVGTTTLNVRNGDDTADGSLACANVTASYIDVVGNSLAQNFQIRSGAGGNFIFLNGTNLHSPASGTLRVRDSSNLIGNLDIGNVTASGTIAGLVTSGTTAIGVNTKVGLYGGASDGIAYFADWSTGTTFNRLGFGGVTSAYPALKRSGTTVAFRLGDDSADAPISCSNVTASGPVNTGTLLLMGDTSVRSFGIRAYGASGTNRYTAIGLNTVESSGVYDSTKQGGGISFDDRTGIYPVRLMYKPTGTSSTSSAMGIDTTGNAIFSGNVTASSFKSLNWTLGFNGAEAGGSISLHNSILGATALTINQQGWTTLRDNLYINSSSLGEAGIILQQAGVSKWQLYDNGGLLRLYNYTTATQVLSVAAATGNITAQGTGTHTFGTTNTVTMSAGSLTATGVVKGASVRTNTITRDDGAATLTLYSGNVANSYHAVTLPGGSLTNSSGIAGELYLNSTINQTSTAGSTNLLINRTETALGSGAHNFIDAQVAGVSKFKVSNAGNIRSVSQNWVSYNGAGADTTFNGNDFVVNYATFTLKNNWGSINVEGQTAFFVTAGGVQHLFCNGGTSAFTGNITATGSGTFVGNAATQTALTIKARATDDNGYIVFTNNAGGTQRGAIGCDSNGYIQHSASRHRFYNAAFSVEMLQLTSTLATFPGSIRIGGNTDEIVPSSALGYFGLPSNQGT